MMSIVLEWVSGALLLVGMFLIVTGAVGILRFPDLYTRMHAAGVTDTLAAICIISGLLLISGWSLESAKLLMILIFLLFASPTSSHALAKAAYSSGLQPKYCKAPENHEGVNKKEERA